jgi:predicted nuclease of predicted toxin-antitoxin system
MSSIRFLLDENVDPDVAVGLRDREIDAVHVRELDMLGATDDAVIVLANEASRILATHDLRDFARIGSTFRFAVAESPGVLLISSAIPQGQPGALVQALTAWVQDHRGNDDIPGGIAWLVPAERQGSRGEQVTERPPAYVAALQRLATLQGAG